MKHPFKYRLKDMAHRKVEDRFMYMCAILPYGGTLRGCKIGGKIVVRLNPTRWALLDTIFETLDPPIEEEWIE